MADSHNRETGFVNTSTAELTDRVVLVTGAGDGIGKAVALACARAGASVVLLGRTVRKLESVYDAIEAAGGKQPAIMPLNLEGAGPNDYQAVSQGLEDTFGRLDALVHAAGHLHSLTPLAHTDWQRWYQTLQVNLNGPAMLTHAVLSLLMKSQSPSVIFTLHPAVTRKAYWGAYGVAKAGLESLMGILADEVEANTPIRVNGIDPGEVRTALRMRAYPAADANRWPEPDSVASAYLYLMSERGRRHHGEIIRADNLPPPAV